MKDFLGIILVIYLIGSLFFCFVGIGDKLYDQQHPYLQHDCNTKVRYKYLFPAYKLGCYLGEEVE